MDRMTLVTSLRAFGLPIAATGCKTASNRCRITPFRASHYVDSVNRQAEMRIGSALETHEPAIVAART
jgi:hypothetical protein